MNDDDDSKDRDDKATDHDPSGDPVERKVGYGQPPIERRFKKGTSGNPIGRPRKKERSLTPRQIRRDVIRVAEAPTTIRTEKGKKHVSVIEAILLRAASKALAGHGHRSG